MKKILICLFAFGSLLCGSCSAWLEVYPKNEQITANYWKAKEDVEAVLASVLPVGATAETANIAPQSRIAVPAI